MFSLLLLVFLLLGLCMVRYSWGFAQYFYVSQPNLYPHPVFTPTPHPASANGPISNRSGGGGPLRFGRAPPPRTADDPRPAAVAVAHCGSDSPPRASRTAPGHSWVMLYSNVSFSSQLVTGGRSGLRVQSAYVNKCQMCCSPLRVLDDSFAPWVNLGVDLFRDAIVPVWESSV